MYVVILDTGSNTGCHEITMIPGFGYYPKVHGYSCGVAGARSFPPLEIPSITFHNLDPKEIIPSQRDFRNPGRGGLKEKAWDFERHTWKTGL